MKYEGVKELSYFIMGDYTLILSPVTLLRGKGELENEGWGYK